MLGSVPATLIVPTNQAAAPWDVLGSQHWGDRGTGWQVQFRSTSSSSIPAMLRTTRGRRQQGDCISLMAPPGSSTSTPGCP